MKAFSVLNHGTLLTSSIVLAASLTPSRAFVTKTPAISRHSYVNYSRGDMNDDRDSFDTAILENRLMEMRVQILEEEYRRPPNPDLSPQEFVSELLNLLWNNYDPLPDSGFRQLLLASTPSWRRKLYKSVGAPAPASSDIVASALGDAMGRPNNQFAIIVGEAEKYIVTYPSEALDYADGTCWLECRLRDAEDNSLLVVMGWELEQRKSDGAWLVAGIDWQDFRDDYRPGIGREEWMRICW